MDYAKPLILHFLSIITVSIAENQVYARYFIVMFRDYLPANQRRTIIEEILNPTYLNFTVVSRKYAQATITERSDFDVVKTFNLTVLHSADFSQRLTSRRRIKGVYPDKILHQSLKAVKLGGALPRKNRPTVTPWLLLSAPYAWASGFCGEGVRVGIFDTGLVDTNLHKHFRTVTIKERTNWTARSRKRHGRREAEDANPAAIDGHGHGTFVTGIIAATPDDVILRWSQELVRNQTLIDRPPSDICSPPGLAPRAELYIFRVFTDAQLSLTSWFLDAFNYAIARRLHVINLSIGGPDFLDQPFVDKVLELSANGILLVSAIGNGGPLYGTLNNPADQMDVLGVGAIDAAGNTAKFSSRGMTAWEMQNGYGRFKPDITTWATDVISSGLSGQCTKLSGTSVASPIVTGVVALLISAGLSRYPPEFRNSSLLYTTKRSGCANCPAINPAGLKQAILEGATPVITAANQTSWNPIFEQGAGSLNLLRSLDIIRRLKPQASLWPSSLDLTNCPYMWPYCSQPLYATGLPIIVNVTILNSMSVYGRVVDQPVYHPIINRNGLWLRVGITYSKDLWPWSGYFAAHISVQDVPAVDNRGQAKEAARKYDGIAEGWISLKVESDDMTPSGKLSTELKLPIRVRVVPTPERRKRILWDYFHNIKYPPAYIPRDDLNQLSEPLDWLGDHIHTNFRDLYNHLRDKGYYFEVLQQPLTCFDASNYGTLMIVDPEEEFFPAEIAKLRLDVLQHGLSVLVFAGWYNTTVQELLRFYDSHTRRLWSPATGGTNVPALNDLLAPLGIQFGDTVLTGEFKLGNESVTFKSGTSLLVFPDSGARGVSSVFHAPLVDIGAQIIQRQARLAARMTGERDENESFDRRQSLLISGLRTQADVARDLAVPVLGLWRDATPTAGRIGVLGDSACLDSINLQKNCFWLVEAMLDFTNPTETSGSLEALLQAGGKTVKQSTPGGRPKRPADSNLYLYSRVISAPLIDSAARDAAFRPLPQCVLTDRTLYAPATLHKEMTYRPQPLRLYPPPPPLPDPSAMDPSTPWCHSQSPSAPPSVDILSRPSSLRRLLLLPSSSSDLLTEYFGFLLLSTVAVLLLFYHRQIAAFLSTRHLLRCLRDLCHRLRCVSRRQQTPTTSPLLLEAEQGEDVDDGTEGGNAHRLPPTIPESRNLPRPIIRTSRRALLPRLVDRLVGPGGRGPS